MDAYADLIQRIIKKIRVGEENVLQEAIHDFIQWLNEAHLSMQNYWDCHDGTDLRTGVLRWLVMI